MASHPKMDSLLRNRKSAPSVPVIHDDGPAFPQPSGQPSFDFTMRGDPMGKPRMTQRDKWQKRPVVVRYRQYLRRPPCGLHSGRCHAG